MLTHIVVWKYKKETSEETREEHRRRLKALPEVIPNIESFQVGADMLHLDRSYDTGLVAIFPDQKALDFYTVHEAHQKVAGMGKEIAEHAVSVDFLV
jgi:hypothetical protein